MEIPIELFMEIYGNLSDPEIFELYRLWPTKNHGYLYIIHRDIINNRLRRNIPLELTWRDFAGLTRHMAKLPRINQYTEIIFNPGVKRIDRRLLKFATFIQQELNFPGLRRVTVKCQKANISDLGPIFDAVLMKERIEFVHFDCEVIRDLRYVDLNPDHAQFEDFEQEQRNVTFRFNLDGLHGLLRVMIMALRPFYITIEIV